MEILLPRVSLLLGHNRCLWIETKKRNNVVKGEKERLFGGKRFPKEDNGDTGTQTQRGRKYTDESLRRHF